MMELETLVFFVGLGVLGGLLYLVNLTFSMLDAIMEMLVHLDLTGWRRWRKRSRDCTHREAQ